MKEDIEYLQRFINRCKKSGSEFYGILKPGHFESLQNLINKYKEQEKIIELMVEYIDFDKIELNCSSLCVKDNCREQCIIEYFKKKARE